MDACMPGLDGITATLQINARWPWVRVIAHGLAEKLRAAAVAAGADALVPKGASVQALLPALGEPAACMPGDAAVCGHRS